MMNGQWLMVNG